MEAQLSSNGEYFIILFFAMTMFFIPGISYAQNPTLNETADGRTEQTHYVYLSKTSSANIIISNGTSFVGPFSTTYAISGNTIDIKDSKNVIQASIIDDFTNSSTIGYVKLSNSVSNTSSIQIANPFVSKERIEQQIQELLERAIPETTNTNDKLVSITCSFGNSIDAYSCSVIPIPK